jgi:hypothetical protein
MHIDGWSGIAKRARFGLVTTLVCCGFASVTVLWSIESSRADGLPLSHAELSAFAGVPASHGKKARTPVANDASSINEKVSLEITQIKGDLIYAAGRATGSFTAPASLYLKLVNASRAEAQIYVKNSQGSLYAYGVASYYAVGSASFFKGIKGGMRGTGKFADVKNEGVKMSGTMNRRTLQISILFRGKANG